MIPYRKSWEIVGYSFHATVFCLEHGEPLPEIDPEGNEKHPIFLDAISEDNHWSCDECGLPAEEW